MPIDLEELERLATQVMPAPWETKETVEYHGSFVRNALYLSVDGWTRAILFNHLAVEKKSAAYIVAACNSLPELIAENRALQERAQMRQELVEQYEKDIASLRQKVRELERQNAGLEARLRYKTDESNALEWELNDIKRGLGEATKEAGE